MILLVTSPWFRRRFRRRRADDSIPVRPLIDILLYWCCATFGGLFASAGIVALIANQFLDVQFERNEVIVMVSLALIAPLMFFVAFRSWRKLNHSCDAD